MIKALQSIWHPFEEVVADQTRVATKVQRGDYLGFGEIPIVDQGQEFIAGYTNSPDAAYSGQLPVVVFGDHTRALKYVDFPFAAGADGVKVLCPRRDLEARFLFYYLRSVPIQNDGYSRHFKHLRALKVPVPAVSEQRRIVDLLARAENIMRMRREVEAKAKEIIPALFIDMFGDPATNPKGWDVRLLGALVRFVSGGTPSKARPEYWEGPLPWVSPKDMKVPEIFDAEDHVSSLVPAETNIKLLQPGAILIVVRGMILVHTVPVAITRVPATINQDMKALFAANTLSSEFLMWLMRISQEWLLTLVTTAAHGTRKIDTDRLEALPIPVPPKEMQDAFVRRVTSLVNIGSGQTDASLRASQTFQSLLADVFGGSR